MAFVLGATSQEERAETAADLQRLLHRIEVRAMAPSVLGADGEEDFLPALFGVFSLERFER